MYAIYLAAVEIEFSKKTADLVYLRNAVRRSELCDNALTC